MSGTGGTIAKKNIIHITSSGSHTREKYLYLINNHRQDKWKSQLNLICCKTECTHVKCG